MLAFEALTAVAVWNEGMIGIFSSMTRNYGSMQIDAQLAIALVLVRIWTWRDAKTTGRNV